jgi:hypothetical protein
MSEINYFKILFLCEMITIRKMIYGNTLDQLLVSVGNGSRYQYWWAYQPIPIIYY